MAQTSINTAIDSDWLEYYNAIMNASTENLKYVENKLRYQYGAGYDTSMANQLTKLEIYCHNTMLLYCNNYNNGIKTTNTVDEKGNILSTTTLSENTAKLAQYLLNQSTIAQNAIEKNSIYGYAYYAWLLISEMICPELRVICRRLRNICRLPM